MTPEEVLRFFEVQALEDALDVYEERLFEIKKELLQKPLLQAILRSRKEKLKRLSEVESVLFDLHVPEPLEFSVGAFQAAPAENWQRYSVLKQQWKQQLMSFTRASEVLTWLDAGANLERNMSESIPAMNFSGVEPVFGKEPDPMDMETGFRMIETAGFSSWNEVYAHRASFEPEFLIGLDRLSLIAKYI